MRVSSRKLSFRLCFSRIRKVAPIGEQSLYQLTLRRGFYLLLCSQPSYGTSLLARPLIYPRSYFRAATIILLVDALVSGPTYDTGVSKQEGSGETPKREGIAR